jgi:hypothetical protein
MLIFLRAQVLLCCTRVIRALFADNVSFYSRIAGPDVIHFLTDVSLTSLMKVRNLGSPHSFVARASLHHLACLSRILPTLSKKSTPAKCTQTRHACRVVASHTMTSGAVNGKEITASASHRLWWMSVLGRSSDASVILVHHGHLRAFHHRVNSLFLFHRCFARMHKGRP